MKITQVRVTPINIPLELPFLWTAGLYPGTSKTIIEIETDADIIGLGEAPSDDLAPLIARLGERLIGQDPLDLAHLESLCVPPWQIVQNTDGSSAVTAFGSLEIALWDIRGKLWNQPLYQLLGGAVRTEIPFTEYFAFRMSADGQRAELRQHARRTHLLRHHAEHVPRLQRHRVPVAHSAGGRLARLARRRKLQDDQVDQA